EPPRSRARRLTARRRATCAQPPSHHLRASNTVTYLPAASTTHSPSGDTPTRGLPGGRPSISVTSRPVRASHTPRKPDQLALKPRSPVGETTGQRWLVSVALQRGSSVRASSHCIPRLPA